MCNSCLTLAVQVISAPPPRSAASLPAVPYVRFFRYAFIKPLLIVTFANRLSVHHPIIRLRYAPGSLQQRVAGSGSYRFLCHSCFRLRAFDAFNRCRDPPLSQTAKVVRSGCRPSLPSYISLQKTSARKEWRPPTTSSCTLSDEQPHSICLPSHNKRENPHPHPLGTLLPTILGQLGRPRLPARAHFPWLHNPQDR